MRTGRGKGEGEGVIQEFKTVSLTGCGDRRNERGDDESLSYPRSRGGKGEGDNQ
jgi:hypothetical protein